MSSRKITLRAHMKLLYLCARESQIYFVLFRFSFHPDQVEMIELGVKQVTKYMQYLTNFDIIRADYSRTLYVYFILYYSTLLSIKKY